MRLALPGMQNQSFTLAGCVLVLLIVLFGRSNNLFSGPMPTSPEEFSALAYASRERLRAISTSATKRSTNRFVPLFVAAFVAAILIVPVWRIFPVGPAHSLNGIVEAVGFSGRGALTASVRLTEGKIVQVGVPYSAKLSVGSTVIVREQPVHFGPPRYFFAGVPKFLSK